MPNLSTQGRHYQQIEKALVFLEKNRSCQPDLHSLAKHLHLSEFHLQRLFVSWVGISPKRFLQFLNREYCKNLLDLGYSTTAAAYQAGFSSPSRLHDLFISSQGITPAQYRSQGSKLCIRHGFHDSPFGSYLLGLSPQGVCHLAFLNGSREEALEELQQAWPLSRLETAPEQTAKIHDKLFSAGNKGSRHIPLLLKGSPFQLQVWQALLDIPPGRLEHYQGLADKLDRRGATRAVASAVARNRIALLIPCHRVIRKIGEQGEYRWGRQRKKFMLACEAAGTS